MTYFLISSSFSSHLVDTFLYNLSILVYICSLCLLTWFNSCDLSRNKEVFLRQIKKDDVYKNFAQKINQFIHRVSFLFSIAKNMFRFEITVVSLFWTILLLLRTLCMKNSQYVKKDANIHFVHHIFNSFYFLQIFTHMKLQKFYCFQHWHKFGGF